MTTVAVESISRTAKINLATDALYVRQIIRYRAIAAGLIVPKEPITMWGWSVAFNDDLCCLTPWDVVVHHLCLIREEVWQREECRKCGLPNAICDGHLPAVTIEDALSLISEEEHEDFLAGCPF